MMFPKFCMAALLVAICTVHAHLHHKTNPTMQGGIKLRGFFAKSMPVSDMEGSIGKFGVDLHKNFVHHYYDQGHNILVSPIGVYYSLALTHLGAAGQTRDELQTVMGFPTDEQRVLKSHIELGELHKHLQGSQHANVTLYDGIFMQTENYIKNTFKDQIKKYYDGFATNVNFHNIVDATKLINQWFSEKTDGKIGQFYDHSLPDNTQFVVANALRFTGKWSVPFSSPQMDYFHTEDGHEQKVEMMHKMDNLLYYDNGKYETVGVPYENNEWYMYIVLPHESIPLKDVVDQFSYEDVTTIVTGSSNIAVDMKMPRIKVQMNDEVHDVLRQMGVRKLFESPDLTNMLVDVKMPVKLSQIYHYVDMDISEYGVDISGGTAHHYQVSSGQHEHVFDDTAKQFYAQRPYMYFIYHPETKTVLIYGSIYKVLDY